MKLARDTLRGYILEEVLAYLIRNTGYRLLVDTSQDPEELGWRHNGLVVKGRGAVHQVDVLGELSWIPAFTYPLRLFVEAKFRRSRTGITEVRNMVATLMDVNQNNLPQLAREHGTNPQLRPKYYYAGSIFSASGFSSPAMDMALAHSVSLIELNTPEFEPLLDAVTSTADSVVTSLSTQGTAGDNEEESGSLEDEDELNDVQFPRYPGSRSRFMLALRSAFRQTLHTQTSEIPDEISALVRTLTPLIQPATQAAFETGELFVGMGQGPYMLVLKADDPNAFLHYAKQKPTHAVEIRWRRDVDRGATWNITPVEPPPEGRSYRLSFRVPRPIYEWIFSTENVRRTALDAKKKYFSSICIFHTDDEGDLLIRLQFNPDEIVARGEILNFRE